MVFSRDGLDCFWRTGSFVVYMSICGFLIGSGCASVVRWVCARDGVVSAPVPVQFIDRMPASK